MLRSRSREISPDNLAITSPTGQLELSYIRFMQTVAEDIFM